MFKSIDLVINCGNIDNNSTIEEIEGKKFPTDSISLIFYKYISNSIVKETVDSGYSVYLSDGSSTHPPRSRPISPARSL